MAWRFLLLLLAAYVVRPPTGPRRGAQGQSPGERPRSLGLLRAVRDDVPRAHS